MIHPQLTDHARMASGRRGQIQLEEKGLPLFTRPEPIDWSRLAPLFVILAAACGGDRAGESDAPEPDPYISTESPRESLTETDFGEFDPADVGLNLTWTRNTVSKDPNPNAEPARLTAVTTEHSRGYDRVVFSFEGHIPGYRLGVTSEGGGGCDGMEAATDAPAHLTVELQGAQASQDGSPLIRDRNRATDYPALVNAVQTCDENETVRWVLGVTDARANYRIMETLDEPRLVVDLRHP